MKKHSPLDIANLMGDAAHKKSKSMAKKDAIDEQDEVSAEADPVKDPIAKKKAAVAINIKKKSQ